MRYIAKPDTWFDAGTEAVPEVVVVPGEAMLFAGMKNGQPDEEVCRVDEFEVIED